MLVGVVAHELARTLGSGLYMWLCYLLAGPWIVLMLFEAVCRSLGGWGTTVLALHRRRWTVGSLALSAIPLITYGNVVRHCGEPVSGHPGRVDSGGFPALGRASGFGCSLLWIFSCFLLGLPSSRGQRGNSLANGQYSLGTAVPSGQDRRFLTCW